MGVDLRIPGFDDVVEVGRGGFAVVFRAWQAGFDREVAIKVLTVRPGGDVTKAFRGECAAIGSLSGHPNIVTVHDVGESPDGRPFIVMEYLHGGSLGDVVRSEGPLPWTEAAETGIQVAGALESAHRAGLLHRDVKPENVLVSRFGQAKLGDFGIALLHDSLDAASGGTAGTAGTAGTVSLIGSLRHAAPEVLDGRPPSVASDVYSLGSTVFTSLAGHPPFSAGTDDDQGALRARIATADVPDLRPFGVPDAVCRVVERALAKDPADRQPCAEAVGRQLQDALAAAGSAVPSMPVDSPPAVRVRRRRRRAGRAATLVAAVALVTGAVVVVVSGSDAGDGAISDVASATTAAPAPTSTAPAPTSTAPDVFLPPPRPGSFSDDFSGSGPQWVLNPDAGGSFVLQKVEGQYRVGVPNVPPDVVAVKVAPLYAPITAAPAHSVHMEVDATKVSSGRTDFGVMCGGPDSQFPYAALIDTGGWWRIVRVIASQERSGVGDPRDLQSGRHPSSHGGPGPYRISLECVAEGNRVNLTLAVDGVQLGTAIGTRGTSFGPGPGLYCLGLRGSIDILFDNVDLTYS